MKYEIKCLSCGKLGWARGNVEEDTNAWNLREEDLDEICECLSRGGEYEGTGNYESPDFDD